MSLLGHLRRRFQPIPLWLPISLPAPQSLVRVRLCAGSTSVDVTENQVIAALDPLTIAMGASAEIDAALAERKLRLIFQDSQSGIQLGGLNLNPVENFDSGKVGLRLFATVGGSHCCISAPRRAWNRWWHAYRSRTRAPANNFVMAAEAVQQLLIFYICPRPVVLVSVNDGSQSNLFPMDLIGPVGTKGFTLALRNTSPSVATLRRGQRAALADLRPEDFELAYRLGHHHKLVRIDTDALPFPIRRSELFGLPLPESALRIREVKITDWREVGSHTLFLTRIVAEERRGTGRECFHTSGIHREFRLRTQGSVPWVDMRQSGLS